MRGNLGLPIYDISMAERLALNSPSPRGGCVPGREMPRYRFDHGRLGRPPRGNTWPTGAERVRTNALKDRCLI